MYRIFVILLCLCLSNTAFSGIYHIEIAKIIDADSVEKQEE